MEHCKKEYDPHYGNIIREEYRNDEGKLHRENGPAIIGYNRAGEIIYERFFINGEYFQDKDINHFSR